LSRVFTNFAPPDQKEWSDGVERRFATVLRDEGFGDVERERHRARKDQQLAGRAKQLGLRAVIEDEFHTLWWVPSSMSKDGVARYIRALDRAEKAMDADLAKYLPLWELSVPEGFTDRKWDYAKFSRGERFVAKPFPEGMFDKVFEEVDRWDLGQFVKDKTAEGLSYTATR